jgi:hypothetical protein
MSSHDEFNLPVKPSREEQAASVRAEFPECSASVDFMRDLFGDDVSVLAMSENGKEVKPKNYKADGDYPMWLSGARFLELGDKCRQADEIANRKDKDARPTK